MKVEFRPIRFFICAHEFYETKSGNQWSSTNNPNLLLFCSGFRFAVLVVIASFATP